MKMMRAQPPEERIIFGRTYIETLMLTIRFLEIRTRDVDALINIALRLEEEICGLIFSFPELGDLFRGIIMEILEKEFPEIPRPEIKGCRVFDRIFTWVATNINNILSAEAYSRSSGDILTIEKNITLWIVRSAQQAFLFRAGLLTVSPARRRYQ